MCECERQDEYSLRCRSLDFPSGPQAALFASIAIPPPARLRHYTRESEFSDLSSCPLAKAPEDPNQTMLATSVEYGGAIAVTMRPVGLYHLPLHPQHLGNNKVTAVREMCMEVCGNQRKTRLSQGEEEVRRGS